MDLVSVLIPCRDAAPWIRATLKSALAQTGCDLEVIVVDDGSSDGSYEIARSFASSRCQVVRSETRGASAARNRALSLAQGNYIQYLDADDLLTSGKIAHQLAALHEHGPRALSWSSVSYQLENELERESRFEIARPAQSSGADFLARLWGANGKPGMIAVHQWLAARELIEQAGPWDESLSVDDDGEFFARVVLRAEARIPVADAHCTYRKFHHTENLSSRVHHHAGHRRRALEAACLKARHLLEIDASSQARRAVSRLLTQQIVEAYPNPAYRRGLKFLRQHGLDLSDELEAPPWFQGARPLIGWKAARLVQDLARSTRRLRASLRRDDDAVGRSGRCVR